MCLKKRCQLSKHTKEEYDKLRNQFKKRIDQRFDRKAAQYIANFEETEFSLDDDLDNESLDEIKALLVDILLPPSIILNNENFEVFFTLLNLVEKAEEMAINLANRSFSHFFITISNVSPNHINSANTAYNIIDINPFAYIATDQYLSEKFYKILIDTSVSKHSTIGYGQFMTYTRDIKYTTIDISKTSAIPVQFGIGLISFIRSVLIQIPIGHIEFHIVKADNPFLLCFADMDCLSVYFNNINNWLVMKSTCIPVIRHFDHPFLL